MIDNVVNVFGAPFLSSLEEDTCEQKELSSKQVKSMLMVTCRPEGEGKQNSHFSSLLSAYSFIKIFC